MNTKLLFVESVEVLRNTLPHYHIVLEAILVLWIVWFISKRRSGGGDDRDTRLSKELVERKLAEWQPESLVSESPCDHPSLRPRHITTSIGKRVTVNGNNCLNLGTHNYLGLSDNVELIESAEAAIKKYGVGSCGPRGFYGTVDVHLELEDRLAKFLGMEEAIIYSYGFATLASAIPAYCKRNDLIFVDERVNFAVQKGLDASRGNIHYFKHNDVQDLHNLLMKQEEVDKRNPKKAAKIKRFLIVEGIYMNTGDICPLPDLLDLCRKYKLRIFIDESISFGTIGLHGRGITEHFNIRRSEIDMIMGKQKLLKPNMFLLIYENVCIIIDIHIFFRIFRMRYRNHWRLLRGNILCHRSSTIIRPWLLFLSISTTSTGICCYLFFKCD